MPQYAKPTLFRMSELTSFCPPKHSKTDAFILIPEKTGATHFTMLCMEVRPGGEAEMDRHYGREHCYFIVSGYAEVICEGEQFKLLPGDCLWLPPGAEHSLKPIGKQTVRLITVFSPPPWMPSLEKTKAIRSYSKAQVFKMSELDAACPPKHIEAEVFTLIPKETGAQEFALYCTEVYPDGEAEMHSHHGREHAYCLLSGHAEIVCNGEKFITHPGDCMWIPPYAFHSLKPIGNETVRVAVVTSPAPWVGVEF